ncbi:MAG: VCBS domain-containing protein [Rhodospirillaceae bacterium]
MAANLLVIVSGVAATITGSGITASSATAMSAAIDALATQVTSGAGLTMTGDSAHSVVAAVMAEATTTVAQTVLDSHPSAAVKQVAQDMITKATSADTLLADATSGKMVQIIGSLVTTISDAASGEDVNAATKAALGDASTNLATIAQNQAATIAHPSTVASENLANSLTYAVNKYTGNGLSTTLTQSKAEITDNLNDTVALSPPVATLDTPSTTQSTPITIAVLANDSDPQGKTLTLVNIIHLESSYINSSSGMTLGTVSIKDDGTVSYDPGSVFDYLAAGETATDRFAYIVGNGTGQTSKGAVRVKVVGVNDAPELSTGDVTGAVNELTTTPTGTLTDSGVITFSDIDLTDSHSVSATAVGTPLGTLAAVKDSDTTGKTGGSGGQLTWSYSVADSAVEYLAAGQTKVEQFTITVDDGHGGSIDRTVAVTITGTNDAPVVSATDVTGAVTELTTTPTGNLTDSGVITFTDVDLTDSHTVTATAVGTPLGTLTAVKNSDTTGTGSGGQLTWSYSVADSAVEYLAAGQTKVEQFTITVDDGHGGSIDRTVAVTITGTNDAPVAVADTASATEAGGVNNAAAGVNPTGFVLTNDTDVDSGDTKTVTAVAVSGGATGTPGSGLAGSYGTLTLNGNGTYSYAVNNANTTVQALSGTGTLTDTFTYTMQDAAGLTSSSTLTVTIHGVNDAPTLSGLSTASGNENQTLALSGLTLADVDAGSMAEKVTLSVSHGTLTLGTLTGLTFVTGDGTSDASMSFTGTLSDINTALSSLSYHGATNYYGADTLTATVDDQNTAAPNGALTASATVGITLAQLNQAPVLSGPGHLNSIFENPAANPGTVVATLLASGGTVSDADGNTVGIAVTSVNNANGTYEWSSNGTTWTTVTGVSASSALLLNATDQIRFVPNENFIGSSSITYRGWDGTAGVLHTTTGNDTTQSAGGIGGYGTNSQYSGGATPLSASITVSSGATLLAGNPSALPFTVKPSGLVQLHSGTYGTAMAKTDDDAWEQDVGSIFTDGFGLFGVSSSSTAFKHIFIGSNGYITFGAGSLLYNPAGIAGFQPSDGITAIIAGLYADIKTVNGGNIWFDTDATTTAMVTWDSVAPYSGSGADSFQILLHKLTGGNIGVEVRYGSMGWDHSGSSASGTGGWSNGTTYGEVVGSGDASIKNNGGTDATYSNVSLAGVYAWEVSPSGVTAALPAVSGCAASGTLVGTLALAGIQANYSLMLTDSANHRFKLVGNDVEVDDNSLLDSKSSYTITISATAPDSSTHVDSSFTIKVIHDPPLPAVAEDSTDPSGATVAALFSASHVDSVVIASDRASTEQGVWQYSLDGGADWLTMAGGSDPGVILHGSDLLRFLPAPDWHGTPGELMAGLLDPAAVATKYEVISTSVISVNDAPAATGSATLTTPVETVTALLSHCFSDAADAVPGGSAAATLAGIAIIGNGAAADQGGWQYSTDHGHSWSAIGAGLSDATALVLAATDELRFVSSGHFDGTPGGLTVRLIESGGDPVVGGHPIDLSGADAIGGHSHISADAVLVTASVLSSGPLLADDHALGFSGSNHIDVAGAAALSPTAALTVEAWVQLSAGGGSIIDHLSDNAGYRLGIDAGGHLQFTIGDGTNITTVADTQTNLADGGWHQVAASYDSGSSTMHLFVDSTDVAHRDDVSDNALGASTFSDLILGKGMAGALNDVRIWSTANSQAQIAQETSHALTGNEDGLSSYWKFDEQSGSSFSNSVLGANYGAGSSSGVPTFIDLMSHNSPTDIVTNMNASSYKGMLLAAASNGDSLSYAVDHNGAPTHGSVAFNNNAFVYSPTSGHITQDDSFTVDITDNITHSMSTHTMTVHPV